VDNFSRECLGIVVDQSLKGEHVGRFLSEVVQQRRRPARSNRPATTVLTYEVDYAASRPAGSVAATFQGRNSSMRLIGCSAMCSKTKRKYACGSKSLSFAVPIRL